MSASKSSGIRKFFAKILTLAVEPVDVVENFFSNLAAACQAAVKVRQDLVEICLPPPLAGPFIMVVFVAQ